MLFLSRHTLLQLLLVLLLASLPCAGSRATETVASPDGRIVVNCNICVNPRPYPNEIHFYYNIFYRNQAVILDSPLSLQLEEAEPFSGDFRCYDIQRRSGEECFSQVLGAQKTIEYRYNALTLRMQESAFPFRLLDIEFRVTNEGAAFRYRIPQQPQFQEAGIREEESTFTLVPDGLAYVLQWSEESGGYESQYTPMLIRDLPPGVFIAPPLLVQAGTIWLAIAESDLRDYPVMALERSDSFQKPLQSRLHPVHTAGVKARITLPFESPWRIVLIGDSPKAFSSRLILGLSSPCLIGDTSWIEGGKCLRPGWTQYHVEDVDFEGGMNTETMMHYLGFAPGWGCRFLLMDKEWCLALPDGRRNIRLAASGIDLPALIQESRKKGVGLFLWLDRRSVLDQMEDAFPLYGTWGIAGILIDGMGLYDQNSVSLARRILGKAAQYRLLVNFHDTCAPNGMERTYPNLITQEGVLGLEWCRGTSKCDPEHETTIPFTRMIAGPLDFGPGCFRGADRETFDPGHVPPMAFGTQCRQLAMYVVYESPFQMCVDYPKAFQDKPGAAFLRAVPTVWDSTVIVDGAVGDYAVVARKANEDWYLGAITDWNEREVTISLQFLQDPAYRAEICQDRPNSRTTPGVLERTVRVTPSNAMTIPMASGGGFAVHFIPLKGESGTPDIQTEPTKAHSGPALPSGGAGKR